MKTLRKRVKWDGKTAQWRTDAGGCFVCAARGRCAHPRAKPPAPLAAQRHGASSDAHISQKRRRTQPRRPQPDLSCAELNGVRREPRAHRHCGAPSAAFAAKIRTWGKIPRTHPCVKFQRKWGAGKCGKRGERPGTGGGDACLNSSSGTKSGILGAKPPHLPLGLLGQLGTCYFTHMHTKERRQKALKRCQTASKRPATPGKTVGAGERAPYRTPGTPGT